MKMLAEAGDSARNVIIIIAITAIFLVTITSFYITRSIADPLTLLMDKTREVSEGVFECDLKISSPPEIFELTKAFNSMCSKLKAVDKMKSDFFSTMSHELRTPLTSIREGTSLLLEGVGGTITDKQQRLLTIISEESNRLISLVSSLLDLSKMEAGMMIYNLEQASLGPLIVQAITEITPLVEAKKIMLETKIGEELPMMKIDSERILQALRNLIGNAVKFTPDGGQVRVSARPVDAGVEVSVADTGPGIPVEKLTTIFDRFQQVAAPGPYRSWGTGLGLAIVNQVIKSHGGKVWAESDPGRGSTFIFVLPA
jgi:two-component system sensor histidine kinase GlrK